MTRAIEWPLRIEKTSKAAFLEYRLTHKMRAQRSNVSIKCMLESCILVTFLCWLVKCLKKLKMKSRFGQTFWNKKSREFTERFFRQPKMIFGILLVFCPKGGITLKRITSACSTRIDVFFPMYLTLQLCIQWREAFGNF